METNKNFFQIVLSTDQRQDLQLPQRVEEASRISQENLSGFVYTRWNNESLREFIASSFSHEVVKAYDQLQPLAYRSDLGRLCLLYSYGGWYADIGLKLISPTLSTIPVKGMGFFKDVQPGLGFPIPAAKTFDVFNGLIVSQAKHPALMRSIEMIVRNVRNKYYGINPLAPTGPHLFGKILSSFEIPMVRQIGFYMPLTQSFMNKNRACVLESGEICAWAKDAWHSKEAVGGNIAALGICGANNYNDFWHERRVYRED